MKKFFLVLIMAGLLLVSSVVSTQAASVYVDTMVGGTVEDPDGYGDGMLMILISGLSCRWINSN